MRVVYVTSLPGDGPVMHLHTLVPAVADAGVDARVVCATEQVASSFRALGIEAAVAPLEHKLDLGGARRVWPLLADADVVHTHDRRSGLLVRPLAHARRAAVFHTLHGLPHQVAGVVDGRPPVTNRARAAWLLNGYMAMEWVLALRGTVVVPSRSLARFLTSRGFPARRLRVVYNGIDVRRTQPGPQHEPFTVGTAASLEHHKGIDVLLEGCALLARPLRLEIYGDGSLRSKLQAHARSLGVDARFHGRVANVRDRLEELDLFVLPSRDDNLPMALLEAMAAAVPPVATRVGGVPELVVDGDSGLLISVDDAEGLARAVEQLASDPELRVTVARSAARRVQEQFDAATLGRRMVALYDDALGRSTQGQ